MKGSYSKPRELRWGLSLYAKQDHAAIGGQALLKNEVAEILVECEESASIASASGKNVLVAQAGSFFFYPRDVEGEISQGLNRRTREVLISKKPYAVCSG